MVFLIASVVKDTGSLDVPFISDTKASIRRRCFRFRRRAKFPGSGASKTEKKQRSCLRHLLYAFLTSFLLKRVTGQLSTFTEQ